MRRHLKTFCTEVFPSGFSTKKSAGQIFWSGGATARISCPGFLSRWRRADGVGCTQRWDGNSVDERGMEGADGSPRPAPGLPQNRLPPALPALAALCFAPIGAPVVYNNETCTMLWTALRAGESCCGLQAARAALTGSGQKPHTAVIGAETRGRRCGRWGGEPKNKLPPLFFVEKPQPSVSDRDKEREEMSLFEGGL